MYKNYILYIIYIYNIKTYIILRIFFYFTVIELIDFPHAVTSKDIEEKIRICIWVLLRIRTIDER